MGNPMEQKGFETLSLHAGFKSDPTTGALAVPIYQTAAYQFKNSDHAAALFGLTEFGNIYTRLMNPTLSILEERVCALEGGKSALAVSSGQSAITIGIMNIAEAGSEIISSSNLYGGTYTLFHYTLKKMGLKVHFVDVHDLDGFQKAINDKTKLIYVESMGNPAMDVADLDAISRLAHEHRIPVMVDNTFPTPYLLRPFEHGADLVIHSLTKYMGGHGTSIGGVIVDSGKFDFTSGRFPTFTEPDPSYHGLRYAEAFADLPVTDYIAKARLQWLRDVGSAMSPFNAYLILLGIETLALRMDRHSENALKVARFLESHPKVNRVLYPGLPSHRDHELAARLMPRGVGGMMAFGIKGGREAGRRFVDSLELFSHVANVGDAKSMAIHPASTTHSQLTPEELKASGATEDYIRLSIGIETYEDLELDLAQALDKA